MLTGREKISLFLGNFGSGKTEVAVNFALHLAAAAGPGEVTVVDLDLVNPYFRSREARHELEEHGIRVVAPNDQYHHADLPILLPEVRACLNASRAYLVIDVGGDDIGARVLGALHDSLKAGSFRALMVLNCNRPYTGDVAGIARVKQEIEASARLSVTGFVSNTHLLEATAEETILEGYRLARAAEAELHLPLEFVCAPASLVEAIRPKVDGDVLPITRYLLPPWLAARPGNELPAGKDLFRL
jgi:hypothetical protein